MMSGDLRSALDELKSIRAGEHDGEILDEMGMGGLTPEVIEHLVGDISHEATRKTWQEWGPKFAKIADAPFWLIGVEHSSNVDCPYPAPPIGHRMFTTAQASMAKAGWARPMALVSLTYPCCSTCWREMKAVPDEVYLVWPDGEITRPDGRLLVQD